MYAFRRFYSDRFYLDAPTGLLEYNLEVNKKTRRREAEMTRIEYCNKCGNVTEEKRVQGQCTTSRERSRVKETYDVLASRCLWGIPSSD